MARSLERNAIPGKGDREARSPIVRRGTINWTPRFLMALVMVASGGWLTEAEAQFSVLGLDTPNPGLPPTPANPQQLIYGYTSEQLFEFHATYPGEVILSNPTHTAFRNITVTTSGPDEMEQFGSTLSGFAIIGGQTIPVQFDGSVSVTSFGKAGQTTGTFINEMTSMLMTSSQPGFENVQIRESPTLASMGQTTITDISGNGTFFHINSTFGVFTELSLDGGQTFVPQTNGPGIVVLRSVPEPCSLVLLATALSLFTLGARRMSHKRS